MWMENNAYNMKILFQLREDEMLLQLSHATKESFIEFDGINKYEMLEWSPKDALKYFLKLVQIQPQALVTDMEFNQIYEEKGFNKDFSNDSIGIENEGHKKSIYISNKEMIKNDEKERVS